MAFLLLLISNPIFYLTNIIYIFCLIADLIVFWQDISTKGTFDLGGSIYRIPECKSSLSTMRKHSIICLNLIGNIPGFIYTSKFI